MVCPSGYKYKRGYKRRPRIHYKHSRNESSRSRYVKYSRKSSKRKTIKVRCTCIRKRGKHGRKRKVISKLKAGSLAKYGYFDVKNMTIKSRDRALNKARKHYSKETLVHKLNALYVLNKYKDRKAASIFRVDRDYISGLPSSARRKN